MLRIKYTSIRRRFVEPIRQTNKTNKMNANYRIITAEGNIRFVGSDLPSWLTLEMAKNLADYANGDMIYEYNSNGDRLWEVL